MIAKISCMTPPFGLTVLGLSEDGIVVGWVRIVAMRESARSRPG